MLQTTFNNKYYHGKSTDNRYLIISRVLVDSAFQRWKDNGGNKANSYIYSATVERYYSADMWINLTVLPTGNVNDFQVLTDFLLVEWTFVPNKRLYTATLYGNHVVLSTISLKERHEIEPLLRHRKWVIPMLTDPIGGVYV